MSRRLDRHQADPPIRAYDRLQMARQKRVDRVAMMDILISVAKWLALTVSAMILFGVVIVGLLAWLLNRPVD